MAPTRELALQIHAEAEKFGKCLHIQSVALYGGAPKKKQIKKLLHGQGADVIIGTPGRIKDILSMDRTPVVNVDQMIMLVLDEADRMLDMGFERDIRTIVWLAFQHRTNRQTFFYSATWPLDVQEVAADLLYKSVKITVGKGGNRLTASQNVTQKVYVVSSTERMKKFMELMHKFKRNQPKYRKRVLVFANMKVTVNRLAKWCNGNGLQCEVMSGNRSQSQRVATIKRFREGEGKRLLDLFLPSHVRIF
jgi:superfamily II DNA/RNA helicase